MKLCLVLWGECVKFRFLFSFFLVLFTYFLWQSEVMQLILFWACLCCFRFMKLLSKMLLGTSKMKISLGLLVMIICWWSGTYAHVHQKSHNIQLLLTKMRWSSLSCILSFFSFLSLYVVVWFPTMHLLYLCMCNFHLATYFLNNSILYLWIMVCFWAGFSTWRLNTFIVKM